MAVQNPSIKLEEKKLRQRVALWAYAAYIGEPILSKKKYKKNARKINLKVGTDRVDIDKFFEDKFSIQKPDWVLHHPELLLIKSQYETLFPSKTNREVKD